MSTHPTYRLGLALIIGTICGLAGYYGGLPLPWMLGPMIGNTVAAMLGLPIRAPSQLRGVVIPVIGVMLGSSVTAAIFYQIGDWLLTLAILPVFLLTTAAASFTVYRFIGGYDRVTAFYAAMPGGLNEMLIMGEAAGGDVKHIAMAHAARILIVVAFVGLFFGLFLGVSAQDSAQWISLTDLTFMDYAILALCAAVGLWIAQWIGLPAAPVFGPMILSGAAHIAGWVTVAPPTLIVIAAQIVIGTIIGCRFVGADPREVVRDLSLASAATGGMLAVALIFAALVAWLSGTDLSQVFLAFSPGGLAEMSLLALAMGQDVSYVSVMHVIRISFVVAIAPAAYGWLRRH